MFPDNMRAFQEAARTGSIRKAGERLGVAPSSISRQIATLERQIGTSLLERRPGGVALTHAGSLVAQYVNSTLLEYDALRADLDDVRGIERRLVRLAMVVSIADSGPTTAVAKFRERYRGVSFQVRVLQAPAIAPALRNGECDVGIGFCTEPAADLQSLADLPEPIVLAVPNGHPLAGRTEVTVGDLSHWPLALPDQDSLTRVIVEKAAARAHVRIAPVLFSNSFEILRGFVRHGTAIAILPRRMLTRSAQAGELKIVPLAGAAFRDTTLNVLVLKRHRQPRVLKAFAELLVRELV